MDLSFQYKEARHAFDKAFRKYERQYNRGQMIDIEDCCTNDPNQFWEQLKQLGPRKKASIPMEVYSENDEILCDKDSVLDVWKKHFEQLYNGGTLANGPNQRNETANAAYILEQNITDPLYEPSKSLNCNITREEVLVAVTKAKNKKSVGIDMLPNEVLKNDTVIDVLQNFFQLCFDTSRIPFDCLKAIVKPIPKNKENGPRIPHNYRGISIISCVSKMLIKC
jgi:hypothetical protein